MQSYDRRELDAVIVRLQTSRDDGEMIAEERFGWFAAPDWQRRGDEPLPVATLAEPCGVRAMASQVLDAAGMVWTEIFVGGVAAVVAAVTAGLGVAVFWRHHAEDGSQTCQLKGIFGSAHIVDPRNRRGVDRG